MKKVGNERNSPLLSDSIDLLLAFGLSQSPVVGMSVGADSDLPCGQGHLLTQVVLASLPKVPMGRIDFAS